MISPRLVRTKHNVTAVGLCVYEPFINHQFSMICLNKTFFKLYWRKRTLDVAKHSLPSGVSLPYTLYTDTLRAGFAQLKLAYRSVLVDSFLVSFLIRTCCVFLNSKVCCCFGTVNFCIPTQFSFQTYKR